MNTTRREALLSIAAAAAIPAVAQQSSVLTAPETESISALVETILPRTDTPGAIDVGVPAWIERKLASDPQLADKFRAGLAALESAAMQRFNTRFAALTDDQKTALLTPAANDPSTTLGEFFKLAKSFTVDAYYTSKEGLTKELGWHGNTFLTEFIGCTHPEHQS